MSAPNSTPTAARHVALYLKEVNPVNEGPWTVHRTEFTLPRGFLAPLLSADPQHYLGNGRFDADTIKYGTSFSRRDIPTELSRLRIWLMNPVSHYTVLFTEQRADPENGIMPNELQGEVTELRAFLGIPGAEGELVTHLQGADAMQAQPDYAALCLFSKELLYAPKDATEKGS